jgi:transposase
MGDRKLFDALPAQRAPLRAGRGGARVLEADRRQVRLRAVDLDGLVAADDVVRDVWSFVEELNLSELYEAIASREGSAGRPAIDPKILLALWLYATVRGIGSARAVARLCESDVAFQWLCGGVEVGCHTLSDFRVGHPVLLERLLTDSVAALLDVGVVQLDRLAFDGLRVRASAGASSFRRRATLKRHHKEAKALVRRLRQELDEDSAAGERRRQAAQKRGARDRLSRAKAAGKRMDELEAERRRRAKTHAKDTAKQGEPRVSNTDPEARVMKMPDGGFRPAYNGQLVSDPSTGVIVAVAIDTSGSDHGWLGRMLRHVRRRFGRLPGEALADGSFSRAEDIEWAARSDNAVSVFMPPAHAKQGNCPYEPRRSDGPGIAAWRRRMASADGQAIYKHRANAERPHAHFRQRGLGQFTVRGAAKAKTVLTLHALVNNMVQGWRLCPTAA